MNTVKTDDELTSTMGNVLSTSKEEKNDSSDATPTSSTDANTNPTASQTVSDDPISSTSSELYEQSKLPDMKQPPVDEPDNIHSEDHVGDLLAMRTSDEKITEDVEDLVHDLESLLGETADTFTVPSKQKALGEGDASTSKSVDQKICSTGLEGDKIKEEVEETIQKETTNNVTEPVEVVKENSTEGANSNCKVPSTEIESISNQQDISKTSDNSVDDSIINDTNIEKSTEEQSTSETTIQDQPVDSGVEISAQEGSVNAAVEDEDSIGSWELIDPAEAEPLVNSMPGPSGEPVLAPLSRNTADDISSSGDQDPSTGTNEGVEENREAESISTETEGIEPSVDNFEEIPSFKIEIETNNEDKEAAVDSKDMDSGGITEKSTSSEQKVEIAKDSQTTESSEEIIPSEVIAKIETIAEEEKPLNEGEEMPQNKELENIVEETSESTDNASEGTGIMPSGNAAEKSSESLEMKENQAEDSAKENIEDVTSVDDFTGSKSQTNILQNMEEKTLEISEPECKTEEYKDLQEPEISVKLDPKLISEVPSAENEEPEVNETASLKPEVSTSEGTESTTTKFSEAEPKDKPKESEVIVSEDLQIADMEEPKVTEIETQQPETVEQENIEPEACQIEESAVGIEKHSEASNVEKCELANITTNDETVENEQEKIAKDAEIDDEKQDPTEVVKDTEATKGESQNKGIPDESGSEEPLTVPADLNLVEKKDEEHLPEKIVVNEDLAEVSKAIAMKYVPVDVIKPKLDEIEPTAESSDNTEPVQSKEVKMLSVENVTRDTKALEPKLNNSVIQKDNVRGAEEKTETTNDEQIENEVAVDVHQIEATEGINPPVMKELVPDHVKELVEPLENKQSMCAEAKSEEIPAQNKPLAEFEFAPLQLSEDDSDDSETVPRLALEPDESNSPVTVEPTEELPQVQDEEEKPVLVQSVTDTPDNLETILAVASLQSIDIPKSNDMDHIVSERERREMEALAIAVQSITDNSSNTYVEEYMAPAIEEGTMESEPILQAEPSVQETDSPIIQTRNSVTDEELPPSQGAESAPSQEAELVIESQNPEIEPVPATVQAPESLIEVESEQGQPSKDQKIPDPEDVSESVEKSNEMQGVIPQPDLKLQETETNEPAVVQTEDLMVVQEPTTTVQEPTTTVQEADSVEPQKIESEVLPNNEISAKVEIPVQEVVVEKKSDVEIQKNETSQEEKLTNEGNEMKVESSNDIEEIEGAPDKIEPSTTDMNEKDSNAKEMSHKPNSTNETSKPVKTRSNDKPKKHKRADKYEELTINVDVPDREKTYSPKITIKPIKVPDEEVSTTTSSEADIGKGSLKMTITKQSDNMHSILKISDQENSEAQSEQDEPIPKLIIKPKMQQVEQQHSPKMSTRSSKHSPTGSNPRSGSPRITIKPVVKPDKQEPVSPIKIKINTKANTKVGSKEEDITRKVLIKPIVKPVEEVEQVQSPRITIKPIPKPDSEKEVSPRLTIKPIKKPEEDIENEDKERSSPKIIIKPIVKPQETEITPSAAEEEEEVKKRIVLKINKGNLPSPMKESKKREHPPDEDKSEKLAKITVKFSKEGGHPHIVQQQGEDPYSKRPHDEPGIVEKNKKMKVEVESVISTRSRHKEQQDDKSNPGPEIKTKHKEQSHESPVETKRSRKDNLHDKSKLKDIDSADEVHFIESKIDSPIVISEDSRSQDSGSLILLDDIKDEDNRAVQRGGETSTPSPIPRKRGRPRKDSGGSASLLLSDEFKDDSADRVKTPDNSKGTPKAILVGRDSATPSPVPKKRGRPRKEFQVPLEVREEVKPIENSPKAKEPECSVHESGRPKRSCRGQSVCDTLGIKPRKSRGGGSGGGRGRGGKKGVANRSFDERLSD